MKALLIDDERLARNELRRLLAAFPEIKVAGEASNARQAREQMAALKPDLLFLDVQMPGETGMELLESLEPPVPHVIFTTAYDEFAVKAFELNALDYLLKPVDPARLAAAVERLPGRKARPARRPAAGRLAAGDRVFVREGERCWFVEVGQIRLLESEGNYTRVHFGDAQPQLFRSLNAMEERLDPKFFFRANRRQIINIAWIDGDRALVQRRAPRPAQGRRQGGAQPQAGAGVPRADELVTRRFAGIPRRMIEARLLTKVFRDRKRGEIRGADARVVPRGAGPDLRAPRGERGGQDDHPAHAGDAAQADERHAPSSRATTSCGSRTRSGPASGSSRRARPCTPG